MKQTERTRLTTALRDQVAKIAADLRGKMRAPGPTRERAQRLHVDEQVAEDFDVWTDLLSRRAAVLWVLKSVYLRVLEDRGLLSPGRLLDPEAQQLFERLAPHLGETAFLRWVYRDLASTRGGLPPTRCQSRGASQGRGQLPSSGTRPVWNTRERHRTSGLVGLLRGGASGRNRRPISWLTPKPAIGKSVACKDVRPSHDVGALFRNRLRILVRREFDRLRRKTRCDCSDYSPAAS